MAKLRINGDTSGYIDLVAPAVAGTTTLNLPTSGIAPTNAPRFTGNMGVGTTNIESGANITLGRLDVTNEGGQLSFNRSTDDTPYWNIDVYGNTSTPSLRMHNAGTTKVNIDSDGRVTMPYQPAFHAYGSGTLSMSGTQSYTKINMIGTYNNVGGNYSTATSRFTVPVSGNYYFHGHTTTTTATSTGPALLLYRNGSLIAELGINYSNIYYTGFGGSVIYGLSANDYIELYISNYNSTSFTVDLVRTSLTGFLIG